MENYKYIQRKERSEAMLSSGIEPILDGSEFWIPSQNDKGKRYKVTISGQDYLCQCPDHQNGKNCWLKLFPADNEQPIFNRRSLNATV